MEYGDMEGPIASVYKHAYDGSSPPQDAKSIVHAYE